MSDPQSLLLAPSAAFIALCQSQVELLTQALKVDWSAVYLAQGWGSSPTKLFPVVVYPQSQSHPQMSQLPHHTIKGEAKLSLVVSEIVNSPEVEIELPNSGWKQKLQNNSRVILPLIYNDLVMGLLVAGRNSPPWKEKELAQLDKIAQTLAIGCFLDQRQSWYQQQLQQQYERRAQEKITIDNLLHQLRNPLTALRIFGKLLLKTLLPEQQNQGAIQGILRESGRIQDLLQQFEQEIDILATEPTTILALPQASSVAGSHLLLPSITLGLESLFLADVLNPLLVSAQVIAQEKGVELTGNIPSNLPPIQGNSKALREVLSNLIDNAIKYTPKGGTVDVKVILDAEKKQQGVEISDTGYGIPPQDQMHIFERGYRGVQAQGDIAGTGLGLAIVKDLVEQMQGKIELISPNHSSRNTSFAGTTFRVWFPVVSELQD